MTAFLQAIAGPVLGIIIVVLAYAFGIFVSLRCCKSDDDSSQSSPTQRGHVDILDPGQLQGLDIYIVSRSQEYLVPIPRPNLIVATNATSTASQHISVITPSSSPAPAYEEPPTYEDCVQKGFCVNISD